MEYTQKLVRYNFNQAAYGYLASAMIQRAPAQHIFNELTNYYQTGLLLDLGSGPGSIFHLDPTAINDDFLQQQLATKMGLNLEQIISLDLSRKMLHLNPAKLAINADVSDLPIRNNSVASIISNLMLQWPNNKMQAFSEIRRILIPGGYFLFTVIIKPSLAELQKAWASIDNFSHTLEFLSASEYLQMCQAQNLKIIKTRQFSHTEYFAELTDLLRHFKLTGTSLPKSNASHGLGGREVLKKLAKVYPRVALTQQLPLSYHYLFVIVQKEIL